jgi:hypothetical protein
LRDLGAAFDACCNVLIFKFNGESRVDSPANSPIFKIFFGQCYARHFSCVTGVSILVRLPSMSRISRKCARLRQAFLGAFQAPDFESVVRRSPAVSGAEIKEPFRRLERRLGPYAAPQWLEASKQSEVVNFEIYEKLHKFFSAKLPRPSY